jgi:hypothetical protein
MHQRLWGYKVEETFYVGVREQKRLNTTDLAYLLQTYAFYFVLHIFQFLI